MVAKGRAASRKGSRGHSSQLTSNVGQLCGDPADWLGAQLECARLRSDCHMGMRAAEVEAREIVELGGKKRC